MAKLWHLDTLCAVAKGGRTELLEKIKISAQLYALIPLEPKIENQVLWAKKLSNRALDLNQSSWQTLQQFTLPLISKHACSSHIQGIKKLGLNQDTIPNFEKFCDDVCRLSGWEIVSCDGELPANDFFKLISQKKFPAVNKMRPLNAVFCGYEPDFWHEAVGHISLLIDPAYSDLYQRVAHRILNHPEDLAIFWVLLEYGFIKEEENIKAFGAAFVGSFMALQRLERKYISLEPYSENNILRSGIFDQSVGPRRTLCGKIKFYYINSLNT